MGPEVRTESRAECPMCMWADDNGGPNNSWRPVTKGTKHPKAIAAKIKGLRDKRDAKITALKARDPKRRYYSDVAAAAEKKTTTSLARRGVNISATRNSGRSLQDADHLVKFSQAASLEKLTLDTKNQSKVEHPTVHLTELDKVREDAKRAGSVAGGLLIRNKFGRAVVVFAEEDFSSLFV
jgi:hypothetical protein